MWLAENLNSHAYAVVNLNSCKIRISPHLQHTLLGKILFLFITFYYISWQQEWFLKNVLQVSQVNRFKFNTHQFLFNGFISYYYYIMYQQYTDFSKFLPMVCPTHPLHTNFLFFVIFQHIGLILM